MHTAIRTSRFKSSAHSIMADAIAMDDKKRQLTQPKITWSEAWREEEGVPASQQHRLEERGGWGWNRANLFWCSVDPATVVTPLQKPKLGLTISRSSSVRSPPPPVVGATVGEAEDLRPRRQRCGEKGRHPNRLSKETKRNMGEVVERGSPHSLS